MAAPQVPSPARHPWRDSDLCGRPGSTWRRLAGDKGRPPHRQPNLTDDPARAIHALLLLQRDGLRSVAGGHPPPPLPEEAGHAPGRAGVMVLDLLCLMVAYVAGSCRGYLTTIYASVLCAAVLGVVFLAVLMARKHKLQEEQQQSDDEDKRRIYRSGKLGRKEWNKVLMLLAIFVTTITYTAALNPPGGFWEHAADEGHGHAAVHHHRAGDPILLERHAGRFAAFLVFNTTSFAASLVIMTLLLSSRLSKKMASLSMLYWCIAAALLCLVAAYAAGSCREADTTVYIICLIGAVVVCISVLAMIERLHQSTTEGGSSPSSGHHSASPASGAAADPLDRARSLILLLATLAATVTYQAGLDPPGGVWRENGEGHNGGDLILLETHARRYKVFFYCNSAAFVASIVVVIMVQSRNLVGRHALEAAVVLDLFGLMGAYAAGSCRDVLASIYVFALAGIIFAYVAIAYVLIFYVEQQQQVEVQPTQTDDEESKKKKLELEKKRKLMLLLAILAVTITYQAGLTPPGKFWLEHGDESHHIGDPVLSDNYPRRYKAFFYCNATRFMASVAVIVILVGRNLSEANKRYYRALYVCMAAGLIGLLGAYAAGTTRRVKTSIFVFILVGAVLIYAILHIHVIHERLEKWITNHWSSHSGDTKEEDSDDHDNNPHKAEYIQDYKMRKYLMLLGILAASVTYQAGLDPPGGVWPLDGAGGLSAGAPAARYR